MKAIFFKDDGWSRLVYGWHKRKYEVTWEQKNVIHEDLGVFNQIEDKYDYVHLVFEVMTHKLLKVEENSSLKIKIQSIDKVARWFQHWQRKEVEVMSLCVWDSETIETMS